MKMMAHFEYLTHDTNLTHVTHGTVLHVFLARIELYRSKLKRIEKALNKQSTYCTIITSIQVNFHGSDNVPAIVYANEFYPDPEGNGMPAISIPASEHSTMTTWGRDREEEAAKV